ncbi:MAG TPA: cytochrome c [Pseudolabrys sp.]|nr:cytochrome c [Pseudolabrys sp.]
MRAGRIVLGLLVILILCGGAFFFWASWPEIAAIQPPAKTSFDPAAVKRGGELVAIGNCITCHTRSDGKPLAGGRALTTPFGRIYATNITPDPDTGIGRWSQEAFDRAMRRGVDRRGEHLYPAFPYDHFTQLSENDLKAIYAYLMTREPVQALMPANELPFPLNLRVTVAAWKLLFLRTGTYRSDPVHDVEWNHGAYLANSLAHCGACHTPRNFLAAEERGDAFGGGSAEGWYAPALNAASPAPVPWTKDSLYTYLRHGFEAQHGSPTGPMREVVASLAQVPESDVRAIATYVASLAPPNPDRQRRAEALLRKLGQPETVGAALPAPPNAGAAIFAGACAVCHSPTRSSGSAEGINLALSSAVNGPDPRNAIRVIIGGIHQADTEPGPLMPDFGGAFTDAQIADLLNYVRTRFAGQPTWPDLLDHIRRIRQGQDNS